MSRGSATAPSSGPPVAPHRELTYFGDRKEINGTLKRHGFGVSFASTPKGSITCEGRWLEDVFKSGSKIEGTASNYTVWRGNFDDSRQLHGEGVKLVHVNSLLTRWEAQFDHGFMYGLGRYIDSKNTEIFAEWDKDQYREGGRMIQIHSQGSAVSHHKLVVNSFDNQRVYEGGFSKKQWDGYGVETMPNTYKWAGRWDMGQRVLGVFTKFQGREEIRTYFANGTQNTSYRRDSEQAEQDAMKAQADAKKMAQEIRKSLPLDVRAVVDECHKKEAVSKQHSHFAIESWQKQMNDSDLDVKEKVSLKDPYSAMRITKPAKGIRCLHKQCFDLTSWNNLKLTPQTCPFCSRWILGPGDLREDKTFERLLELYPEEDSVYYIDPVVPRSADGKSPHLVPKENAVVPYGERQDVTNKPSSSPHWSPVTPSKAESVSIKKEKPRPTSDHTYKSPAQVGPSNISQPPSSSIPHPPFPSSANAPSIRNIPQLSSSIRNPSLSSLISRTPSTGKSSYLQQAKDRIEASNPNLRSLQKPPFDKEKEREREREREKERERDRLRLEKVPRPVIPSTKIVDKGSEKDKIVPENEKEKGRTKEKEREKEIAKPKSSTPSMVKGKEKAKEIEKGKETFKAPGAVAREKRNEKEKGKEKEKEKEKENKSKEQKRPQTAGPFVANQHLFDHVPQRWFAPYGNQRKKTVRFRRLGDFYFHHCTLGCLDELIREMSKRLDKDEAVDAVKELQGGKPILSDDDLDYIQGFDFEFTVKDAILPVPLFLDDAQPSKVQLTTSVGIASGGDSRLRDKDLQDSMDVDTPTPSPPSPYTAAQSPPASPNNKTSRPDFELEKGDNDLNESPTKRPRIDDDRSAHPESEPLEKVAQLAQSSAAEPMHVKEIDDEDDLFKDDSDSEDDHVNSDHRDPRSDNIDAADGPLPDVEDTIPLEPLEVTEGGGNELAEDAPAGDVVEVIPEAAVIVEEEDAMQVDVSDAMNATSENNGPVGGREGVDPNAPVPQASQEFSDHELEVEHQGAPLNLDRMLQEGAEVPQTDQPLSIYDFSLNLLSSSEFSRPADLGDADPAVPEPSVPELNVEAMTVLEIVETLSDCDEYEIGLKAGELITRLADGINEVPESELRTSVSRALQIGGWDAEAHLARGGPQKRFYVACLKLVEKTLQRLAEDPRLNPALQQQLTETIKKLAAQAALEAFESGKKAGEDSRSVDIYNSNY